MNNISPQRPTRKEQITTTISRINKKIRYLERDNSWDKFYEEFKTPENIQKCCPFLWDYSEGLYKIALAYGHLSEINPKYRKDPAHLNKCQKFFTYECTLLNRCLALSNNNTSYLNALSYRHYITAKELLTLKRPGCNLQSEITLATEGFNQILLIEPDNITSLYRKANLILNIQIPSLKYKKFKGKGSKITALEREAVRCHDRLNAMYKKQPNIPFLQKYLFETRYQYAAYLLDKHKDIENSSLLSKLYSKDNPLLVTTYLIHDVNMSISLLENLWSERTEEDIDKLNTYSPQTIDYATNSFGIHFITYRLAQAYYQGYITNHSKLYYQKSVIAFTLVKKLFQKAALPTDYIDFRYSKLLLEGGEYKKVKSLLKYKKAPYIQDFLLFLYAFEMNDTAFFEQLKKVRKTSRAITLLTYYMYLQTNNITKQTELLASITPFEKSIYLSV